MDVQNKVVIVTGASAGIGLATAQHLAENGAKIVITARSEDKLKDLAAKLPDAFPVKADLRQEADIKNLISQTLEKYGQIDILINNAGQGIYGLVENVKISDYKEAMELNVFSALRMMQAVIPLMKRQGGGYIVNISSAITRAYIPGIAAYSSTKYALNALSYTARQELAKYNIIVSTVLPKMTDTNFAKNSIGADCQWVREKMSERDPSLAINTPQKVAQRLFELIQSEEAEAFV